MENRNRITKRATDVYYEPVLMVLLPFPPEKEKTIEL